MFPCNYYSLQGPRDQNQDKGRCFNLALQFAEGKLEEYSILIICDGNQESGGVLSSAASSFALTSLMSCLIEGNVPLNEAIVQALNAANSATYQAQKGADPSSYSASTATLAIVHNNILYVGYLGDSPLYVYSKGILQQLTIDHTLAHSIEDQNSISELPVMVNTLTRCIGIDDKIDPTCFEKTLSDNDIVIVGSDGALRPLSDEQIIEIIQAEENNQKSVQNLAEQICIKAIEAGGTDNATAAVVWMQKDTQKDQTSVVSKDTPALHINFINSTFNLGRQHSSCSSCLSCKGQ